MIELNEEVMTALNKVCRRIASKYYVTGYDKKDIYQEAYVIGLEILEKYEPERNHKVENFLNVSINNRFQNFIRLKSENKKNCGCDDCQSCKKCRYREAKSKVIHTQQFTENFDYTDPVQYYRDKLNDLLPLIDLRLPASMRDDWRRILDGSHVVRSRRFEILDEIREIVKEHDEQIDMDSRKSQEKNYEFGWDSELDSVTKQQNVYFFIESDNHLVKIYMDEEACSIWLSRLAGTARQAYMKLKDGIDADREEILELARVIDNIGVWDV